MVIGEQLGRLRTLGGLTARQVDRLTGKAPGQTALIEARGTDVRAGTLVPYAELFDVSLDWLVRAIGPEPTADHVKAAIARARAAATVLEELPPAAPKKKSRSKQGRQHIRRVSPKTQAKSPRRPLRSIARRAGLLKTQGAA